MNPSPPTSPAPAPAPAAAPLPAPRGHPFSLTRRAGVLRWNGLLLALLLLPTLAGALRPLERRLVAVMAERPLPPAYFLVFVLLGALLPLLLRLAGRRQGAVRRVLDPYLLLLAGQIVSEVLVVLAGGKGLGVLVGMTFTLARLAQLARLWPLAAAPAWLRGLLAAELLLWGFNAGQMLVQRWGPLLAGGLS